MQKANQSNNQAKEAKAQESDKVSSPQKAKSSSSVRAFTYVGGGEDSPRKINFMGIQEFVRGKATEVTDERVLAKIGSGTHPCFVEGTVDEEELHEYDTKAQQEAALRRKQDLAINAAYLKKHGGE